MEKENKVVIVVCDSRVTDVLSNQHLDLEIVDFDFANGDYYIEGEMLDYIKECQQTMTYRVEC